MIQRRHAILTKRLGKKIVKMLVPEAVPICLIFIGLNKGSAQIPQGNTAIGNAHGMSASCKFFHRLGIAEQRSKRNRFHLSDTSVRQIARQVV